MEDLTRHVLRHSLNVSPVASGLFGLRLAHSAHWLAPAQTLQEVWADQQPLQSSSSSSSKHPPAVVAELRLRFKVPFPDKLRDLDRQAFIYYYHQVHEEMIIFFLFFPTTLLSCSRSVWTSAAVRP